MVNKPQPIEPRTRTTLFRPGIAALVALAKALHRTANRRKLARDVRAGIAVDEVQAQAKTLAERQRLIFVL